MTLLKRGYRSVIIKQNKIHLFFLFAMQSYVINQFSHYIFMVYPHAVPLIQLGN